MLNIRSFLSVMKISRLKRPIEESPWKVFTLNLIPEFKTLQYFLALSMETLYNKKLRTPSGKMQALLSPKYYEMLVSKSCPLSGEKLMSERFHNNPDIIRDRIPILFAAMA